MHFVRNKKKPYIPAIHDAELARLHADGLDDLTISMKMGFGLDRITRERTRLGLPRILRGRVPIVKQPDPPPPQERPNPVAHARAWLGPRVVERNTGYFLDGCPANLDAIIRAANELLKAAGESQIEGRPQWRV
jgi:hypothetical protein